MTSSALSLFHLLIQPWFEDNFEQITDIQQKAWPKIATGEHLVITAPTGSGKTLTAFLWAINQFLLGEYELGASRVLYISPLKALNNDIQRNLNKPLEELRQRAESLGLEFTKIRVLTRSGDTDSTDRRWMFLTQRHSLLIATQSMTLMAWSIKPKNLPMKLSILYGRRLARRC